MQINLVSHASHTKTNISCGLINCRSAINKASDIKVDIREKKLDLYALTETWIKEDDTVTPLHMCPPSYEVLSFPRSNRTGGGIALIYNKCIDVKKDTVYSYKSMECTNFCINHQCKDTKFAVIYRSPDTSIISFITDLTDYIEKALFGDLTIHVNKENNHNTITFSNFLDSFGLIKLVSFSTHRLENTLDIILTHKPSNTITGVKQGRLVSDHHQVPFNITNEQSTTRKKGFLIQKTKENQHQLVQRRHQVSTVQY